MKTVVTFPHVPTPSLAPCSAMDGLRCSIFIAEQIFHVGTFSGCEEMGSRRQGGAGHVSRVVTGGAQPFARSEILFFFFYLVTSTVAHSETKNKIPQPALRSMNGVTGIQREFFFSFLDHFYLIWRSQNYAEGKSLNCQLETTG